MIGFIADPKLTVIMAYRDNCQGCGFRPGRMSKKVQFHIPPEYRSSEGEINL